MRKILAVAVVLVIVASALAFAEATPEVKGSVLALAAVTGGKDEAENKLFEAALEKATGLEITWERLASGYDAALMAKLGAGDPYDLVYLGQFQMYQFASQGVIQDLNARIA